jgi:hypothetical protein
MSQNKLEDRSDEEVMESREDKKESVILQLGDVIRLEALTNEILNNITFIIDYIDSSLIKLVNVETYQMLSLTIHEDGVLGDGSITGVILLYRNDKLGYARQNNQVVSLLFPHHPHLFLSKVTIISPPLLPNSNISFCFLLFLVLLVYLFYGLNI